MSHAEKRRSNENELDRTLLGIPEKAVLDSLIHICLTLSTKEFPEKDGNQWKHPPFPLQTTPVWDFDRLVPRLVAVSRAKAMLQKAAPRDRRNVASVRADAGQVESDYP